MWTIGIRDCVNYWEWRLLPLLWCSQGSGGRAPSKPRIRAVGTGSWLVEWEPDYDDSYIRSWGKIQHQTNATRLLVDLAATHHIIPIQPSPLLYVYNTPAGRALVRKVLSHPRLNLMITRLRYLPCNGQGLWGGCFDNHGNFSIQVLALDEVKFSKRSGNDSGLPNQSFATLDLT